MQVKVKRYNWHWQRLYHWRGWILMLTWGQSLAFGIHMGYGWIAMRINGLSIHIGPLAIDIRPPMPKWMKDEIEEIKEGS